MNLSSEDKMTILLNRLDYHTQEIKRREERETKLFEWATTLLLGVFAVIIALSNGSSQLPNELVVKIIATLLVGIPSSIFAFRILAERKTMSRQAKVIEKIQEEFKFFDEGYYIEATPLYPSRWRGSLSESMLKRKTPVIFSMILIFMTVCVMITIWLML